MLFHVGGPTEGGWRVEEVWESQAALDKFFQEKLGAALQRQTSASSRSFSKSTT